MKLSNYIALLGLCLCLASCTKDICEREITYTKASPVFNDLETLRLPVISDFETEISAPGKIFVYDDFLFISEEDLGVHIIDNTNPEAPENVNFIRIPGNKDLIVKEGKLLADSYYDLLVIDIEDPKNPKLLARNKEVFPVTMTNSTGEALTGFTFETITEKVNCSTSFQDFDVLFFDANNNLIPPSAVPSSFAGSKSGHRAVAGSLSRMASVDDFLYIVNQRQLLSFEIKWPSINLVSVEELRGNIETIFPQNDHLFIGSQNGMQILDISEPGSPQYISQFWHQTACDPVLPADDVAYVTLRTGNECEGDVNRLDVISLRNINAPMLVESISMENPHGLTLLDDKLIVCEGDAGIKIFDASLPTSLRQIAEHRSFSAYDVIAHPTKPGLLLIIGKSGLMQFSLSAENDIDELSTIGF